MGSANSLPGLYSAFDPEIELVPLQGKYADANDPALLRAKGVDGVANASASFEENALILYRGNPLVVTLKGVDEDFGKVTGIDSIVFNTNNIREHFPALSGGWHQLCRAGIRTGCAHGHQLRTD